MPDGQFALPVPDLTGPNSEGSARVHLSARDAITWLRFLLNASRGGAGPLTDAARTIMSPAADIAVPDPRRAPEGARCAYGMGMFATGFAGGRLLHHSGGGRGWRHNLALLPEANAGAIVMAAVESPIIDGLALDLLDRIALARDRDWSGRFRTVAIELAAIARKAVEARFPAAGGDADPIDMALGYYSNPITGRVRLEREGAAVRFRVEDAPVFDGVVHPLGRDIHALSFDEPAMAPQPLDIPFRLQFSHDAIRSDYFGELRRCA